MTNAAARRLSRRAWLSSNRSESSYFSRARPPVSGTRGGAGSRPARTAAGSSGASTMAGSVAHGVTSSMLAGPGSGPIDPRRLFTLDRQHLGRGGGGADQASSGHRASETGGRRGDGRGPGLPTSRRGLDPRLPRQRCNVYAHLGGCCPRPHARVPRLRPQRATLLNEHRWRLPSKSGTVGEPAGESVDPFCWTERCVCASHAARPRPQIVTRSSTG